MDARDPHKVLLNGAGNKKTRGLDRGFFWFSEQQRCWLLWRQRIVMRFGP
jgi:hypothetical protein